MKIVPSLFLAVFGGLLWPHPLLLSAAESLPLPDVVTFHEEAKLPSGVTERSLACAVISEDDNILVVETSTHIGKMARLSLDKTLVAEVKRGDPSLRPFAELGPDLILPPESLEVLAYDEKIDRLFRPFLKKFPDSSHAAAVRDAEKLYLTEARRVAQGEFRFGQLWMPKSVLTPVDLKALKLLQQTRSEGLALSLDDFKTLVKETAGCSASEFFPFLGQTLSEVSTARVAQIQPPPPSDPPVSDPSAIATEAEPLADAKKAEATALDPLVKWNWVELKTSVDMVREAEDKLKTSPPQEVSLSVDLLIQSKALMPDLLLRERVLREQANAYSKKALEETLAGRRKPATSWWHATLLLAAQLPSPANQTLSDELLNSFEKAFLEQATVATEQGEYDQAKAWFQGIIDLYSTAPAAAKKLPAIKKRLVDLDGFLKKQVNQQSIDNLRKAMAEYLVKNDFNGAKTTLATRWDEIQKLKPSPEETIVFAHAALDQAEAALKSFQVVSGCQLIVLAHRIAPDNPRVKTWVLSASMAALGLFLFLLFPLFWIVARSGLILENLRYRFRLKKLRKSASKRPPDPGRPR